MLVARTTPKPPRHKQELRRTLGGLRVKPTNPSENLIELVKLLEKIEITPEKLAFNSKFMAGPDGSRIEY